jgi:quercetin dioxygenase-like cupin family protein
MSDAPVKAQPFRVRTPLTSQGRLDTVLAQADELQIRIKCYAEGGENVLHTHLKEDHSFIILQGQARFCDGDDNSQVLGRNEGIMLPDGKPLPGHSEANKHEDGVVISGAFYE